MPYKTRKAVRAWYKNHAVKSTDVFRKSKYGMTKEVYDAKAKAQDYECALCGRPETHIHYRTGKVQSLAVDHDHKTGKNRGLLCGDCNRGIGIFDDSVELLLKAVEYLKKHKE